MDIANKTAIVTGGSRGIGAAAALLLAREGWRVAVGCHRHPDRAQALCDRLRREGREAVPFCGDVSSVAEMEAQVQAVVERWGQIDLLVNNAGIAQQRLFTEITEAEWDRMFAVNAKGLYACCRAVVPGMIRRHSGNIINVSSMWGQAGASCEAAYSATKGAVIAYTKALAKELGPSNIRVNCVAPGVIDTEMNAHLSPEDLSALADETPMGRIGTPEEAAAAITFLASDEASFLTGQVVAPNGGLVV